MLYQFLSVNQGSVLVHAGTDFHFIGSPDSINGMEIEGLFSGTKLVWYLYSSLFYNEALPQFLN